MKERQFVLCQKALKINLRWTTSTTRNDLEYLHCFNTLPQVLHLPKIGFRKSKYFASIGYLQDNILSFSICPFIDILSQLRNLPNSIFRNSLQLFLDQRAKYLSHRSPLFDVAPLKSPLEHLQNLYSLTHPPSLSLSQISLSQFVQTSEIYRIAV